MTAIQSAGDLLRRLRSRDRARKINNTTFDGTTDITVPAVDSTKEPAIAAGTTSQYWRGDKSWQTLDKSAVGLGNVDNTSDATKNSATATLTNKTLSAPAQTGINSIATGGQTHWFNTADQTTNFERVRAYWAGNVFFIAINVGGTGARRTMRVNDFLWVNGNPTAVDATNGSTVAAIVGSGAANAGQLGAAGTLSASSGVQYSLSASPTINQTSTAGYTALLLNPTETATGSGNKRLIDAQVGGTSRFNVDNQGTVTLRASATIRTGTGTPEAAVTAPVGSLFLRTDGGAGTTLYVKESGTGNTGWVAK